MLPPSMGGAFYSGCGVSNDQSCFPTLLEDVSSVHLDSLANLIESNPSLAEQLTSKGAPMDRKLSCGHYFGEVVRSRHVAGLILTETRYAPGVQLPRHSHEDAYFCLVRRGSYTESYGNKSRACRPLTLAFHPPGEVHSEHFHGAEVWSFNTEVTQGWLAHLPSHLTDLGRAAEFHGGATAGLAMRLYREFQQMDDVSPLAIEGLTLEILAEVMRLSSARERPAPPWVRRIREIVHSQFASPWTLSQLAKVVDVHPVYAATAFRKHFRCSIGQYVRKRRVETACSRLAEDGASLAEIALETGFADQSHFSRVFKQHTGLTPAAYRRQARTS